MQWFYDYLFAITNNADVCAIATAFMTVLFYYFLLRAIFGALKLVM